MRINRWIGIGIFISIVGFSSAVGNSDNYVHNFFAFPPRMEDGVYPRQYRPDRTVDLEHLTLEIKVFMDEMRVEGTAHYQYKPIHDQVKEIYFNAMEMNILNVQSAQDRPVWNYADNGLTITFAQPLAISTEHELSISFSAKPKEGMFFTDSQHVAPEKADQMYTLCEPIGASYWFPCVDYPNDRLVTEMAATVPKEFTTLSNGKLIDSKIQGEWRTDHWKQQIPHPFYLVSLAVGKFDIVKDDWRGIPVEYYVEAGKAKDARPSMGKTPKMIDFFSVFFDTPYPYEKYAQVAVRDFHAGGMEHTTATTLYEFAVIDAEARPDTDCDDLVSHELSHQWFGDYVTCKAWPEIWLNESFATYCESLWIQHEKGEDFFLDHVRGDMENYIHSSHGYTRAIVTNQFKHPMEVFDSHAYPKGGCVLHMLRQQLGDELFRKSIHNYLHKYAPGLVDTDDLMKTIEETTGRPMDQFFEQWIYRPGHPKLKVTHAWIPSLKQVKLQIRQTQELKEGEPAFAFPLEIEIHTATETIRKTVPISRKEETVAVECSESPKSVVIDPAIKVLMELEQEKSEDMWLFDLAHGSTVIVRLRALRQFSKSDSDRVVEAVAQTLNHEPYQRLQEEAAETLGGIHTPKAMAALLAAANHPESKTRRAVISALGNFYKESKVIAVLKEKFQKDKSIHVVAAAARSLGRIHADSAYSVLRSGLERDSYRQEIRTAVMDAFVELEEPKAYAALVKLSHDPYGLTVRTTAIRNLGELSHKLKQHETETLDLLVRYLDSGAESLRSAAIHGLSSLRKAEAIPHLQRVADHDAVPNLREQAQSAIKEIQKDRGSELSAENAKKVNELEQKQKKQEERIKELEMKLEKLGDKK